MHLSALLLVHVSVAVVEAWPNMGNIHARDLPLSENEGNSGPFDSLVFNASEQHVNVTPGSANEYQAPGSGDLRGPCPGLNAAANHGFLPHNGVTTLEQTVTGLGAAYGFGPEFAAALSAIAIALSGDITTLTWSIGGSYSPGLLDGLLSNPEGISNSHNAYESDASPTRGDAYLNGGDAVSLKLEKFEALYNLAENYTLDILRDHNKAVHDYSVNNNPYFFSAPFAGLVPPIAHHFVVNLMSNHSDEEKNGYLDRDILKTFFAISGEDGAHVWNKGQEQIPQNWYRRPSSNPYGAVPAVADVLILATKYPEIIEIGGNTGTVNSFTGVDLGDLTGGVYNATTLLEGNNLGCFLFQALQQGLPSELEGVVSSLLTPILTLVNENLSPVLSLLDCPALNELNDTLLEVYPGYSYKTSGETESSL